MTDSSFTCSSQNKCQFKQSEFPIIDKHEYMRIVCLHCGATHDIPVYCGNRFCPICSKPRLSRVRDRISWLIKHRKNETGTMLKHLTLTIKSEPNLSGMVVKLLSSFRKLRYKKFWKRSVIGGCFVVEVTHSPAGWHAHLHILIQSYKINWTDLRNAWVYITSGSRGVYIRNLSFAPNGYYLTKYMSKTTDNPDLDEELNGALKGTRLFQPFGSWYAINNSYKPPMKYCSSCGKPAYWIPEDIFYGKLARGSPL